MIINGSIEYFSVNISFCSSMYWSDWGENASGIYRSGMDGSHRISLVSYRISWPNSMTIDHITNRLYWTDIKLNTIEYITLDGKFRKVFHLIFLLRKLFRLCSLSNYLMKEKLLYIVHFVAHVKFDKYKIRYH